MREPSARMTLRLLRTQGFKSLITNKVKEPSSKTTQFFYLARRKGFEPLAFGSVDRRYIQLS